MRARDRRSTPKAIQVSTTDSQITLFTVLLAEKATCAKDFSLALPRHAGPGGGGQGEVLISKCCL